MTIEIPQYGLKAYALLFSRHGTRGRFMQSALDWVVSVPMKKKIFSLLLRSGWIQKNSDGSYSCSNPADAITGLLDFRVPEIMKEAKKPYAFTKLSAIEVWSDFSYVQRGIEKSPYFIKISEKDVVYWKNYFSKNEIPYYVDSGQTIGEYVIIIPVKKFVSKEKDGFRVDSLQETLEFARSNDIFQYAVEYMENKYGAEA
ncbi:MAG: hypothetical protein ABIJ21_00915 [Nanoarchaeota archaeon]